MLNLFIAAVAALVLNVPASEIPAPVDYEPSAAVAVAETEPETALAPPIVAYEIEYLDEVAAGAGYDVREDEGTPDALRVYFRTDGTLTERILILRDGIFFSVVDETVPELGGPCHLLPATFEDGWVIAEFDVADAIEA